MSSKKQRRLKKQAETRIRHAAAKAKKKLDTQRTKKGDKIKWVKNQYDYAAGIEALGIEHQEELEQNAWASEEIMRIGMEVRIKGKLPNNLEQMKQKDVDEVNRILKEKGTGLQAAIIEESSPTSAASILQALAEKGFKPKTNLNLDFGF